MPRTIARHTMPAMPAAALKQSASNKESIALERRACAADLALAARDSDTDIVKVMFLILVRGSVNSGSLD